MDFLLLPNRSVEEGRRRKEDRVQGKEQHKGEAQTIGSNSERPVDLKGAAAATTQPYAKFMQIAQLLGARQTRPSQHISGAPNNRFLFTQ